MPDIFDEIEVAEPGGDIFDDVSPETGDIFDEIKPAPVAEPDIWKGEVSEKVKASVPWMVPKEPPRSLEPVTAGRADIVLEPPPRMEAKPIPFERPDISPEQALLEAAPKPPITAIGTPPSELLQPLETPEEWGRRMSDEQWLREHPFATPEDEQRRLEEIGAVPVPALKLPTAPTIEEEPQSVLELIRTAPTRALFGEQGADVHAQVVRSLYNAAKSLPEFFTTEEGALALLASMNPAGQFMTTAYFTYDMAKSLIDQAKKMGEDWDKMTGLERARSLTDAVATLGMAGTIGLHLVKQGRGFIPKPPPGGPPLFGDILPPPRAPAGPEPIAPPQIVSPDVARAQSEQMTRYATAAFEPRPAEAPVVPETLPQPYETVITEARRRGLDTIQKVLDAFPSLEGSRERARAIRNAAFPETAPKVEPTAPLGGFEGKPLEVDYIAKRLAEKHGIQLGTVVKLAENFGDSPESGRLIYDPATRKPIGVELNRSKLATNGDIDWTLRHELAHWFDLENPDLSMRIREKVTGPEWDEIEADIRRREYKPSEVAAERTVFAIQKLAEKWRDQGWFGELVGNVSRFVTEKTGIKLTRSGAEATAVRAIQRGIESARKAEPKPKPSPQQAANLDFIEGLSNQEFAQWLKDIGHSPETNDLISKLFSLKDLPRLWAMRKKAQADFDALKADVSRRYAEAKTPEERDAIANELMRSDSPGVRGQTLDEWARGIPEVAAQIQGMGFDEYSKVIERIIEDQKKRGKEPVPTEPPTETAFNPAVVPTVEFPIEKIVVNKDVPQFKEGADPVTGVVPEDRLDAAAYERVGTAPVVLWEKANGETEIVTGRNRLDLARRTGEKTIPAQIVREADGFTRDMALTFDAEANIRDGQGTLGDYAHYFRNTPALDEATARARGLLSRAKGQAGWLLGKIASDDLYAKWRMGQINDAKAIAIARAAGADPVKQQLGIKLADQGKSADFIRARIERETAKADTATQTDMFGNPIFDDTKADAEAEKVAGIRRTLQANIKAAQNAARDPEAARRAGIDVKDPQGTLAKVAAWKAELEKWNGAWWLDPELRARVTGKEPAPPTGPAEGIRYVGRKPTAPWPRGMVSRSPDGKGWRFTWFSEFEGNLEPRGHKDFPTRAEAEKYAADQDFEPEGAPPGPPAAAGGAGVGKNWWIVKTAKGRQTINVDPEIHSVVAGNLTEKATGRVIGKIERLATPEEIAKVSGARPAPPPEAPPEAPAGEPVKPPTPPPKAPEGAAVRPLLTPEEQARADELIKILKRGPAGTGEKLFTTPIPVDVDFIKAGGELAYLYLKGGVRRFAHFSTLMLESLGERAKPYLLSWYDNAKLLLTKIKHELDSEAEAQRYYDEHFAPEGTAGRPVAGPVGGGGTGGGRPSIRISRKELIPKPREYVNADSYAARSGIRLDADQVTGVNLIVDLFDRARDATASFLLADGTGFGKTMQMLAVADQYIRRGFGKRILVITENQQVLKGRFEVDADWMGVNADLLTLTTYTSLSKLASKDWDLIIFDEAHNLKNAPAKKSILAAHLNARHKIYGTATPMDKFTAAAYFLSEIVGKDELAVARDLGFTMVWRVDPITNKEYQAPVLLEGFSWDKVWANIMAYRDAAIQAGALIRREYPFFGTVKTIEIPMPEGSLAEQQKIVKYYDALIEGASMPQAKRNYSGQKTLTLRRWSEQQKLVEAVRMAKAHLDAGGQVIIVAETANRQSFPIEIRGSKPGLNEQGREVWFVDGAIAQLTRMLNAAGITDIAHIHSPKEQGRKLYLEVRKFQDGKARVALATSKSGGTGIDLDDSVGNRPRLMIALSKDLAGDKFEQLVGRVSRKNTKSPAQVRFLHQADSFADNRTNEILDKKIKTLKAIQAGEELDMPPEAAETTPGLSLGPGAASPAEFAQRQAGAGRVPPPPNPPVATEGGALPTPEVVRQARDYHIFNRINSPQWLFYFGRLGAAAKRAWEMMVLGEFRMRESIRKDINDFVAQTLRDIPRPMRKDGGKALFQVLDGRRMEEIESEWAGRPGGNAVIQQAERVKTRLEEIRTTIRNIKRDSFNRYLMGLHKDTLLDLFRRNLGDVFELEKMTKQDLADALTMDQFPDDWGIADGSYLPHIFFGQWKVMARLPGVEEPVFVTRAQTIQEAKARIYERVRSDPDMRRADFSIAQDAVIPADMIRLGDRRFWNLVQRMKAQNMEPDAVKDALRGNIGRKAAKQKWWGSLQHREGYGGYSQDYSRVMASYLNGFHRWRILTSLNRRVQPMIEQVRAEGRINAAERLQTIFDNLWGKPTEATRQFDAFVRRIPGLRDWIKPLALDRWARFATQIAGMMTLRTLRFSVVNRLQPLQGLYPIVGERGIIEAKLLQHSDAGRRLLQEAGVDLDPGQYAHELAGGSARRALIERFSGERSNQELAFLAMYQHGRRLGLDHRRAVQYGKLRGQLMTQFTPLVVDTPELFEGPFGRVMFQFKRFPVKQVELMSQMVADRNIPAIARLVGAFAVLGGLSFMVRQTWVSSRDDRLRAKRALDRNLGTRGADTVMYGLPGFLGADISGSITLGDEPMGQNIYEKTARMLTGPAVAMPIETARTILTPARQRATTPQQIETTMRRIPTLRPLAELSSILRGDLDLRSPDGEVKLRRNLTDALMGLGSFRSANEANISLAVNGIMALAKEEARLKNEWYVAANKQTALKDIAAFNLMWPEATISTEDLSRYRKYRDTAGKQTDVSKAAKKRYQKLIPAEQRARR